MDTTYPVGPVASRTTRSYVLLRLREPNAAPNRAMATRLIVPGSGTAVTLPGDLKLTLSTLKSSPFPVKPEPRLIDVKAVSETKPKNPLNVPVAGLDIPLTC